jgi:hypothetical protein
LWATVTAAVTLFEAVRQAWEFFQDDFWRGPKPNLDTIFEVRRGSAEVEGQSIAGHF